LISPICFHNKAKYFRAKAKQEVVKNALHNVTMCRIFCTNVTMIIKKRKIRFADYT